MAESVLKGVLHGKTIELDLEPGLPDGQTVAVTIQRLEPQSAATKAEDIPAVELWAERLVFDSAALPGERVVKGTCLPAEALVAEMEQGRSDQAMLHSHPQLTVEDLEALRQYGRVPVGLRRSFGAWAEEAEELDEYLEWTRQHRKIGRREIDE